MPLIQTGTGFSTHEDSYHAGKEAAEMALSHVGGRPQALLVFASSGFDHDLLLGGIRSVTGDIPMAGGSTAGEISPQGLSAGSVVILALESNILGFSTACTKGIQDNPHGCATEFVKAAHNSCRGRVPLALILLPDGTVHGATAVIEGIQAHLSPSVDLIGGLLGSDERLGPTSQYHNGNVITNSVTGLLIHAPDRMTDVKTGAGCCSGFTSIGNSMVCTSSRENVLEKIDHVPALDFYMDVLGEKRSARLPEVCLEYPFGIADPGSDESSPSWIQIRSGISVDYEKKTITIAGPIAKGSLMTLATCSRGDLINAARSAAEQARDGLGGCQADLVLVFSCVGRKNVLGRRANEEVEAVKEVFGDGTPVIGFYTHGEIGPVSVPGQDKQTVLVHNESIVVWGLGGEQS